MTKTKIAVLFGGASSEHEISLMSATSVLNNLDKEKYDIVPVGITKSGRWYLYNGDIALIKSGEWEKADITPAAFCAGSGMKGLITFENGSYNEVPVDVVFPVLHGKNGEDGTVQGLLDMAGIPYVGCGVLGSSVCMDKVIANCVMDACGIPRCEWDYMDTHSGEDFDDVEARVSRKLGYPIFVKPANAGSSVGISKAKDRETLKSAVELAAKHDNRIVFERFVDGQEVECAVSGNDVATSTCPGEILASKEFYDYEDKYVAGTSRVAIPAQLSNEKLNEVHDLAEKAYRALCCTGLSRVDFFVERGSEKVLLNEINTLPGFTDISMYPKLKMAAGDTYSSLLDKLVALAFERAEGRDVH
ncbi:MAG: D-alanine--D-alanine ligase [Clostridia bacterium]|jgi:D-alanine-D-alanine ligase|nr:D-alanine--D-alanine ligase [Clostridia bacterium]NLS84753.1 D-alanine--D-alanine ligase [Oscillospiraceae bacterium]